MRIGMLILENIILMFRVQFSASCFRKHSKGRKNLFSWLHNGNQHLSFCLSSIFIIFSVWALSSWAPGGGQNILLPIANCDYFVSSKLALQTHKKFLMNPEANQNGLISVTNCTPANSVFLLRPRITSIAPQRPHPHVLGSHRPRKIKTIHFN